jgi:hypothetical protein
MATLRGQGAFQGVNLIVHAPAKGVVMKDGKETGRFLDVQVDQSLKNADKVKSGEAQADSNPHLASYEAKGKQGNTFVSHRVFYSEKQMEAIKAAAGKKVATLENGDAVYGIKADVMKNSKGQLLINTEHDMTPSKNPYFGKNVLDKQNAVTGAAKEYRTAQRAAEAEAKTPEVEAEAQAKEAENDAPDV